MNSKIQFPSSYQESRVYFHSQLESIKDIWPSAALNKYSVSGTGDLTIDWISADPIMNKDKLILITTGLHGVEGFVGAGMLDLFIKEYIRNLDPETTGICLVHAINPWGMANIRRVNQNNVDLNRNFMEGEDDFLTEFNLDYKKLNITLNPSHALKNLWAEDIGFFKNAIINLARNGIKSLRGAVMLGQLSNSAGLYFSGKEYQPETICLKNLISDYLSSYDNFLSIDMHTGYGPRYQMTLVNSPGETRTPDQLKDDFQYPRILQADPDQFYKMQGDMIDWIYKLKESKNLNVKLYGTAFEFGTYGEGILKEVKSLRTMVYENQAFHHSGLWGEPGSRIKAEIQEMYFPASDDWREKAIQDCRQAFAGVLSAEGYL